MAPVRTHTYPYKYRTRYRIFSLFLSSPRAWYRASRCFLKMADNSLDRLAEASSLMDTLRSIQREMKVLREDVNRLKTNDGFTTPLNSFEVFYCYIYGVHQKKSFGIAYEDNTVQDLVQKTL